MQQALNNRSQASRRDHADKRRQVPVDRPTVDLDDLNARAEPRLFEESTCELEQADNRYPSCAEPQRQALRRARAGIVRPDGSLDITSRRILALHTIAAGSSADKPFIGKDHIAVWYNYKRLRAAGYGG